MKNTLKLFTFIALAVIMLFVMTACVSSVRLYVDRMPNLDTKGINRIAVMPFSTISREPASREMAQYITTAAVSRIQALNHFTLVDSSVITRLQNNNENIEAYVDALFAGQVTRVNVKESSDKTQRKDKDGLMYDVTTYTREVEIEFNYQFTRARDGSLIGPVSRKGTAGSSSENRGELQAATALLRSAVDTQLRSIDQDLVPHTVTEYRRLEKEPSKDKELQRQMKDAQSQVRMGNYRIALESYLGIYAQYGNISAALNASMLYEALRDTQGAADFMQAVYAETGNYSALNEFNRLTRNMEIKAEIAADFSETQSLVEKVSVHASEEIRNIIPQNARVWIFNDAADNNMATAVVDNVTADFIRRGIGIVDRQSAALIEAEQRFQVSGYVSDSDFVNIGNAAGANTIVVIGLTGTGDMRRLQLRVLDIERGVPIFQSDTSDVWRL